MRGYLTDPGAPRGLRLDDAVAEREAAPDEAVVAVEAFALNRGELLSLAVRGRGWRPGRDAAGTVAVPAADGSGPAAGTRVVAIVDEGSWSDQVTVPTDRLAPLPDGVSITDAAALPTAGLTALRALREGGSVLGERVVVTAATGGVGQFAVQLARAAGAHVTALVSRPESLEEARAAGAHTVITDLADGPGGYRLAFDGAGGDTLRQVVGQLAPHGVVVAYGAMAGPTTLSFADLHATINPRVIGFVHVDPPATRGADLGVLADLVASGAVVPRIGLVDDWSRAREALDEMSDGRVRGRVVMTVGA